MKPHAEEASRERNKRAKGDLKRAEATLNDLKAAYAKRLAEKDAEIKDRDKIIAQQDATIKRLQAQGSSAPENTRVNKRRA